MTHPANLSPDERALLEFGLAARRMAAAAREYLAKLEALQNASPPKPKNGKRITLPLATISL